MTATRSTAALIGSLWLLACAPTAALRDGGNPEPTVDAGSTDASHDAAAVDASSTDAPLPDASLADAARPDTSSPDTSTAADAGAPDAAAASLCVPGSNLIPAGALDDGMVGEAPAGWEVRAPGQPAACAGSAPASGHVYASSPAPGCSGGAITIDANGAWDCYAVQKVSDYNSIEGGARYRIRTVARASGNLDWDTAYFVLGVQWLDASDAFFGDEKNPRPVPATATNFDWKVIEWELVAPADARRILVWMTGHYPGKVEYDHVAVVRQ